MVERVRKAVALFKRVSRWRQRHRQVMAEV